MKLLHIDSSILGSHSVSRHLSKNIVEKFKDMVPGLEVIYRNLDQKPLPHLSGVHLAATRNPEEEHHPDIRTDITESAAALQELIDADIVVIGVAFYNFSIASQLKAWVDRILIAGQTFRYNAEGRPEGLLNNKRIILAISRGGFYGPGSPIEDWEHAETYLRTVFSFIGLGNIEVIAAEGIAVGDEQRETSIKAAKQHIAALTV